VISQAVQDYLKVIYTLQASGGAVSTSTLAAAMGVSAPSATGMVKKLSALKLARHARYQGVVLTRTGERVALEVIRHHRLLELYLAEALGYPWDRVHEEACRLEHAISEEFEDKIFEALGRPTRDPHGEPIPTKEGSVAAEDHEPLSELEPGSTGVICQVSDYDGEMLRYLGERGLVPDATVEVLGKEPFDGPLTVRSGKASHSLGRNLARRIRVKARADHES
jgi:DtxR family Mn-dependent transcriptional regulator